MKNKSSKFGVIILTILILFGCNIGNSNNSKSKEVSFHFYPYTYDLNKAKEKGLVDERLTELSEYYVELQEVYRVVLEAKLKDELSLVDFNEDIHTLDKYYSPYTGEVDVHEGYQSLSTMDLDYVFLRNNIHIENLSDEDIALLKSKVDVEDLLNDKELTDLVDRTFLEVLEVKVYGFDGEKVKKDQQIPYNTRWSSCCALEPELFADTDAIVIEVRAEDNFIDGMYIEGHDIARDKMIKKLLQYETYANQIYKVNIMYYGNHLEDYKMDN
jgi:hypothetical protein